MNIFEKKYHYLTMIFPLMENTQNWWEIFFSFINPGKKRVLRMKNDTSFVFTHHLEALTVKESLLDRDYDVRIRNPKVIIDIGANIGTEAVFYSKKYPKCNVYSFEPVKSTFNILLTNIFLNNCSNVTARNIGISGKRGTIKFYSHPASGLSSFVHKRDGMKQEIVKIITLADIFKQFNLSNCDLLKIDSEGSEYATLFSAPKSLYRKIDNIVLEYHDSLTNHKHEELVDFLRTQKYKINVIKHNIEEDIGLIYAKR